MFRLRAAPGVDGGVVAGEKNLRHGAAFEEAGSRVLRIFQQVVLETLLDQRRGPADHAGQQPHAGVDHRHRGDLPAREHVVTDAELGNATAFQHTLVNSLETAADQRDAGAACQRLHLLLSQRGTAGREQEARRATLCRPNGIDGRCQDIGAHDHTRPPAERMIVDGAVFIARKAADVHRFQPPEAGIEAAAGERGAERARKDLGVEGQHPRPPGRGARRPVIARAGGHEPSSAATTTTMRPASISMAGTCSRVKGTRVEGPSGG